MNTSSLRGTLPVDGTPWIGGVSLCSIGADDRAQRQANNPDHLVQSKLTLSICICGANPRHRALSPHARKLARQILANEAKLVDRFKTINATLDKRAQCRGLLPR
ncbi:hypothetical protein [Bradyrhizobium macuxiense]|uniref:hypothetical protein n=1 Tax=Bradyrhizobium macuxiense TaxID=1755647 RepID=UPI0010A957AC|nr:hypothetical protein [Bradyrhizobium macuxiense]